MHIVRRGENGSSIEIYMTPKGFFCGDCTMNLSAPLRTEGALLSHIHRHRFFGDTVPDSIRSDIQDYFAEYKPRFPLPKLDPNDPIYQMAKFSNLAIGVILEEEVQARLGNRSDLVPSDLEVFDRVWASILSKLPLDRFVDDTYTAEVLVSRYEEWSRAGVIEACIARDAALREQIVVGEHAKIIGSPSAEPS